MTLFGRKADAFGARTRGSWAERAAPGTNGYPPAIRRFTAHLGGVLEPLLHHGSGRGRREVGVVRPDPGRAGRVGPADRGGDAACDSESLLDA